MGRWTALISAATLGVALAAPAGCASVGPAPALSATTLDGKSLELSALGGKVVALLFWTPW